MKDKKLLEEICEGCDKEYCFLKEIMLHNPMSEYTALQLKMIEKFKWDWSTPDHGYSWDESAMRFAEEYGAKYREMWDEGEFTHHVNAAYWALRKDK